MLPPPPWHYTPFSSLSTQRDACKHSRALNCSLRDPMSTPLHPRLLRLKTLFVKCVGVLFSVSGGLCIGKVCIDWLITRWFGWLIDLAVFIQWERWCLSVLDFWSTCTIWCMQCQHILQTFSLSNPDFHLTKWPICVHGDSRKVRWCIQGPLSPPTSAIFRPARSKNVWPWHHFDLIFSFERSLDWSSSDARTWPIYCRLQPWLRLCSWALLSMSSSVSIPYYFGQCFTTLIFCEIIS